MFRRFIIRLVVCIIVCGGCTANAWAETKTLQKDANYHPQGWSIGGFIKFRGNTTVRLNEQEEVISGTLYEDTFLPFRSWERETNDVYSIDVYHDIGFRRFYHRPFIERDYTVTVSGNGGLLLKGGTVVTFSEQGDVRSGTIAEKTTVRLVAGKNGFITWKANTVLTFYPSGTVLSGTLNEDTYLRPVGWKNLLSGDGAAGYIKFSKGKTVQFTEAGEVTLGTLADAATLIATGGERKPFPAGTAVEFNEIGAAVKSDKLEVNMP